MISYHTLFADGKRPDDWLSPILVKELRQGMRARAFVLSFLLIQVFLIVLVLGNVAASNDRSALDFQNGFFWVIVGFALLVLMPMRGLVTISLEVKNHTMETVMLTRLTAWRVVFGKWNALFAQSLLFVSAVLPYVVLRYFIGGDDVVFDFELLLLMLWSSGMLIAACIAVSAMANAVIRIILIILGVWVVGIGGGEIFGSSTSHLEFWEIVGWLLIFGFFIPALLFEFTAASIAPSSENHSLRIRLLALAFFILSTLMDDSSFEPGIYVPLIVLVGVCYYELAEKPRLLPRLVQPFCRFGLLGRLLGNFLLPGWPSALLFSLLVIPSAVLVEAAAYSPFFLSSNYPILLIIPAIFGSVLTPILICHLFWPKMKQVALMIILYNLVLLGVASVLDGFSSLLHANITLVLAFVPSLPVLLVTMEGTSRDEFIALCPIGNTVVLIVLLVVLLATSRRYFRDVFALVKSIKNTGTSSDKEASKTSTP